MSVCFFVYFPVHFLVYFPVYFYFRFIYYPLIYTIIIYIINISYKNKQLVYQNFLHKFYKDTFLYSYVVCTKYICVWTFHTNHSPFIIKFNLDKLNFIITWRVFILIPLS